MAITYETVLVFSVKNGEEAAKALVAEEITSVEELDAAIAAMEINADVEGAVSTYVHGIGALSCATRSG